MDGAVGDLTVSVVLMQRGGEQAAYGCKRRAASVTAFDAAASGIIDQFSQDRIAAFITGILFLLIAGEFPSGNSVAGIVRTACLDRNPG
jgi:hypothetical protein